MTLAVDRRTDGRTNRDSENLKKIAISRFERNALKVGDGALFGVYPLRGSGPQILFLIIIALGALRQRNYVWRESAHIWGSYGGLKIASCCGVAGEPAVAIKPIFVRSLPSCG